MPPLMPVNRVSDAETFRAAMEDIVGHGRMALDTESNGFFRYPERVCLLQIATPHRIYLIDPLALSDLAALGTALSDPGIEKILHGADYDLRSVHRQWGFRIKNLFDTGVAAHFIGMTHLGLGALAEELLGKTLLKDKRLQRADWSVRPLSQEALDYAAEDVESLMEIRDILWKRLTDLGRTEWVLEEFERMGEIRHVPGDPETAFLNMKGSGALHPRALAVLRALWTLREQIARREGKPPFRILPEKALLFLSVNPQAEMETVPGLGPYAIRRWGPAIQAAVKAGTDALPVRRPRAPREHVTAAEVLRRQNRLRGLKIHRALEGKRLDLDPSLLWPSPSFERLAKAPETVSVELNAAEVRRWQRGLIAPLLPAWIADAENVAAATKVSASEAEGSAGPAGAQNVLS